jgi:hypothetical protein
MTQLFIVCHEGELPYVIHDLRDVLHGDSTVQIVSQGSTEKMYMGYVLLESEGDIPTVLLRELRANPDVYLYAVHDQSFGAWHKGRSRALRNCWRSRKEEMN